jgi:hypothetical protein
LSYACNRAKSNDNLDHWIRAMRKRTALNAHQPSF